MRLPGFTAAEVLHGMSAQYAATGARTDSDADGKVVPQLFYIRVGPGRCAVGEYAGGACWFYGIVSC